MEGVRRLKELETKNAEERLTPLRRVLRSSILLLLGYYAIWILDGFMDQAILGAGGASLVLFFLVELLVVSLLLQYGVGTIADMVSSLAMGPDVRAREQVLVANIGNFHTLAFRLEQAGIAGVFEHHTGFMTTEKMDSLLTRLADGSLKDSEVFDDHGHGDDFI